jgi:uncharacterized membrane protein
MNTNNQPAFIGMIIGFVAIALSLCGGCNLFSLAAMIGAFIFGGMGMNKAAEMDGQGREQGMIAVGLASLALLIDIGWCVVWSIVGVIVAANS